jgi:hypothetical protein
MTTPRFTRFLLLAREHTGLLIDLCTEPDVLSRAQLLHYMEHHSVPAALKDALIDDLTQTAILLPEQEGFTVNAAVVDIVNYYERRGRLISATFLRDQMLAVAELTDRLRRELFAPEPILEAILDLIDNLSRLVREVREAGLDHYIACMRLLGDIKRTSDRHSLERRLQDLETAQRRYIEPLRALIDPSGEYVPRIVQLQSQVLELGQQNNLLAQSQELDRNRRRLGADLHFIDHDLLRGFAGIVDTARTLLKSLMDEKSIKDALAFCLGRLDDLWPAIGAVTIAAPGRNTFQAAPLDRTETFFIDVVHRRLLPRPRSLTMAIPERSQAEDLVLTETRIWRTIAEIHHIPSWPAFVTATFDTYGEAEQLRAMVMPLLREHPHVRIQLCDAAFTYRFARQHLEMRDFGVRWEESYGH